MEKVLKSPFFTIPSHIILFFNEKMTSLNDSKELTEEDKQLILKIFLSILMIIIIIFIIDIMKNPDLYCVLHHLSEGCKH